MEEIGGNWSDRERAGVRCETGRRSKNCKLGFEWCKDEGLKFEWGEDFGGWCFGWNNLVMIRWIIEKC